ncbi:MAG: hypothetical protein ACR2QL_04320 [Woeseiaceae bacterium]
MSFRIGALAALVIVLTACAEKPELAIDGDTTPEEHESYKTEEGFFGWVVIVTDDWIEKVEHLPDGESPEYEIATEFEVGETVVMLVFFANPGIDEHGNAEIRCDLKSIRPDGSVSLDSKEVECHSGPSKPYGGNPEQMQLSPQIIEFVGEEDDLRGEWVMEVRLTDAVRDVSMNLTTRVTLNDAVE